MFDKMQMILMMKKSVPNNRISRLNSCKASFDNDNILLLIIIVNNRNAPFTFPFSISCLNLVKIFYMFIGVIFDGNLSCIFLLCFNNSLILPSSHNFICLSSTLKCYFTFDFLLGFCKSNAGIIWIASTTVFFNAISLVERFRTLQILFINFLPASPVGTLEIILSQ